MRWTAGPSARPRRPRRPRAVSTTGTRASQPPHHQGGVVIARHRDQGMPERRQAGDDQVGFGFGAALPEVAGEEHWSVREEATQRIEHDDVGVQVGDQHRRTPCLASGEPPGGREQGRIAGERPLHGVAIGRLRGLGLVSDLEQLGKLGPTCVEAGLLARSRSKPARCAPIPIPAPCRPSPGAAAAARGSCRRVRARLPPQARRLRSADAGA